MRKKLLALLLCAALLCGASLPALGAEGTADAQLSQVTQAVKDVLGLDTTAYGSFQGERYEGALAPTWSLSWSGDAGSLYIEALEDGKILSYSLVEAQTEESYGGRESLPALPQGDEDAALAAAQAFLGQVLEAGLETAGDLETGSAPSLYGDSYRFTGTILLRGLPSPLRFSVTVRGSDCTVTRFSRDALETSCLGGVPAAAAETGEAEAAALLESTLSLRLEYVLPEAESTHAVLRYLPDPSHEFYVDGETGELVDLTELRQKMYGGASGGEAPEESAPSADADAGNAALTPAEQEGIQKLEGVLSSQALDQRLREEDAYGLGRYELVNASYRLIEGEEDQEDRVECTLRYSRTGEDGTWGRTFTVDARTGEVASLWSSAPWDEDREPALTEEEAQARAEAFLQSFAGDRWEHLALYEGARAALLDGGTGNAPFYTFTFARQENGYFFPTHSYTVGIDAADGSVSSLAFQYEEDVTFDDPQGIVDAEAALDAWMGTYDVALGYLYVPAPLDGGTAEEEKLAQMGYAYHDRLRLGYALERTGSGLYLGVDAKTGEPVEQESAPGAAGLAYEDLEGHWARETVERLAGYGIGYDAARFQPDKALTQWELVCLLYSTSYGAVDPEEEDSGFRDQVYAAAYRMGALTREARDDGAALTRAQVVRMLLDAAGFGQVAGLEGIFTCAYTDPETIPAGELGYAALAQGLGLVTGTYAGDRAATRAEAAVLLERLMDR